jgi:hypothetical protein
LQPEGLPTWKNHRKSLAVFFNRRFGRRLSFRHSRLLDFVFDSAGNTSYICQKVLLTVTLRGGA